MMYTDWAICDSIDIKFRIGQQASIRVKMSDCDLCLTRVLTRPILLYNTQREKIVPVGGLRPLTWTRTPPHARGMKYAYRFHRLNTYATTIVALWIRMNALVLVLVGNISSKHSASILFIDFQFTQKYRYNEHKLF